MSAKSGPITRDELLALWRSGVDGAYGDAFVAAGDGQGLEVYGQAFAQFARVSQAVETNFQSLYVRPWSGQTLEQARGARRATVQLTITRTRAIETPLVIGAGLVWFEEQAPEWSDTGTILARTGRRYTLVSDLVMMPGEAGPIVVDAVAEAAGWGYNAPLPGSISFVAQVGSEITNTNASIVVTGFDAHLVVIDTPDVVVPDHVGQYVRLASGTTNNGAVARMVSYGAPNPPADGGSVALEQLFCFEAVPTFQTFVTGEVVEFRDVTTSVVGTGRLIAQRAGGSGMRVALTMISGTTAGAVTLFGQTHSATATIRIATWPKSGAQLIAESGTVTWTVLDWSIDFGLAVTNVESPKGGRIGVLDAIGAERRIYRAPGESDDSYAARVAAIPDTISPNALRRAANRVLSTIGSAGCLREVGDPAYFPGFFYDGGGSAGGDATHGPDPFAGDSSRMFAWDMDFTARPSDRFKLWLDSTEMRAFFLLGVPFLQSGETGFFYDGDVSDTFPTINAYDAPAGFTTFYDGSATGQATTYGAVYRALAAAKAAGVGFDLYVESISCP